MITIVDYGMGNMGSIQNMLRRTGHEAEISSDVEVISKANKLILPGVGAFDAGMEHLNSSGLKEILEERVVRDGVPLLGICLGMQLLFDSSEEGTLPGLSWLSGKFEKFTQPADGKKLRVPHMGWNSVHIKMNEGIFSGLGESPRFYFVHSYRLVQCLDDVVAGTTQYGGSFVCAVQRKHIWGVQFHPEKSHRFGIRLLTNFANS